LEVAPAEVVFMVAVVDGITDACASGRA
jgi:hypothetical protein